MKKVRVSDNAQYIDTLSKKYNLPKKVIKLIIKTFFINMKKGIMFGKDIDLKGDLGYIYFEKVKKAQAVYKLQKRLMK